MEETFFVVVFGFAGTVAVPVALAIDLPIFLVGVPVLMLYSCVASNNMKSCDAIIEDLSWLSISYFGASLFGFVRDDD